MTGKKRQPRPACDPGELTKLDRTLARKKTKAAADAAPILAMLGLTPVFTAEQAVAKRVEARSAAAAGFAASEAKWVREIEAARVECIGLAGVVAVVQFEQDIASSPIIATAGLSTKWSFWMVAKKRAAAGEPLLEVWTPGLAKPRVQVDPDAVFAVVRGSCVPIMHGTIADELGGANVLDVCEATRVLREQGRIRAVERNNRFRGWEAA